MCESYIYLLLRLNNKLRNQLSGKDTNTVFNVTGLILADKIQINFSISTNKKMKCSCNKQGCQNRMLGHRVV
jgi:hypothetical protein